MGQEVVTFLGDPSFFPPLSETWNAECVLLPKDIIMMKTNPASGRNAVDCSKVLNQIVADRFLEAIARGTSPDFIDTEIKAANSSMKIGTMLAPSTTPDYVALSIKFLALASYCEARPPLTKHAATLREAGRICAVMIALNGSDAEKARMTEVALNDPSERHALTAKLLRISALPKNVIDSMLPEAVRRSIWAAPTEEVVVRTMTRARLIHVSLSQGREAEAREAAAELGRDVLAVFLQQAGTSESLHIRGRLMTIMNSLTDAGAFMGTNISAMLEVAIEADHAAVRAQGADPADRISGH